jgi:hypothetical protein
MLRKAGQNQAASMQSQLNLRNIIRKLKAQCELISRSTSTRTPFSGPSFTIGDSTIYLDIKHEAKYLAADILNLVDDIERQLGKDGLVYDQLGEEHGFWTRPYPKDKFIIDICNKNRDALSSLSNLLAANDFESFNRFLLESENKLKELRINNIVNPNSYEKIMRRLMIVGFILSLTISISILAWLVVPKLAAGSAVISQSDIIFWSIINGLSGGGIPLLFITDEEIRVSRPIYQNPDEKAQSVLKRLSIFRTAGSPDTKDSTTKIKVEATDLPLVKPVGVRAA